ncbi:MAG TPA: acetyl-CoA carboxylase biotin carboxyl carrier protein subunit [Cytophagales bacterium]|nr:acetyl-CoA carboxylase biotin carboxyl carrier protein subunit [Cytophagales bacterium]HAA17380.1 acetyl-CoA carboxylase biotin carboxyl carrier protein subunit [Cytophagales bacterium]HAP61744.1 acetyl-CoA carboxylase biotin carboxyl carrier protein subunit [Cytophagales bacterium]
MYKAQVNDKKALKVESNNTGLTVEDNLLDWDIQKLRDGYYHIVYQDQSYTAELVSFDKEEKEFDFLIGGHNLKVKVQDRFDLLLDKLGMTDLASAVAADLKAPMPGLVLEIMVQPGQEVQKGDAVLILEAMKMENVLKAPGDGTVTGVQVAKGDSVEKNQVMIQF